MAGSKNLLGFVIGAAVVAGGLVSNFASKLVKRPRTKKMDALIKHVNTSERHSFDRVAKAVDAIRSNREIKA
jgi:hypothetical protein